MSISVYSLYQVMMKVVITIVILIVIIIVFPMIGTEAKSKSKKYIYDEKTGEWVEYWPEGTTEEEKLAQKKKEADLFNREHTSRKAKNLERTFR